MAADLGPEDEAGGRRDTWPRGPCGGGRQGAKVSGEVGGVRQGVRLERAWTGPHGP